MNQDQWTKIWKAVASIAVALSVIATALAGINISTNQQQAAEINQLQAATAVNEVEARGGSNTPIYFTQGGSQLIVGPTGALSVTGRLTVTSAAVLSGMNLYGSASITPTDGGTLTPTAEIVTLTPAGALGTDLGVCTSGQSTILYNSVNASVVITDTGNGILAGNQTLGQYDALRLVCISTKWVQVSAVSAN